MSTTIFRPYQIQAINEIHACYKTSATRKVLLHLATGAGKTVIFCEILKRAAEKGRHAIMVVRGRKLVSQGSERLDKHGVEHGVLMAGSKRFSPKRNIQVCSIDTLYSRKNLPKADLIIIDEAHQASSSGYKWFLEQYPNAYVLAVTATPFVKKSLRHVADKIIHPISMNDLIAQGFLVPPKYFAPSTVDLTGVSVKNDDFVAEELDAILNQNQPIGDVIESWKRLGENRPTLLFAVSINHSSSIANAFVAAGIPAAHLDAESTDDERNEAIKKLNEGSLKILCNVGIFCEGVDIPAVSCIVMARPTKSYPLYIQQAGRGTRVFGDKKDFLLIDNSGNILRHGLITEEREGSLDPIKKGKNKNKKEEDDSNLVACDGCSSVFSIFAKVCPSCGLENHLYVDKTRKILEQLNAGIESQDHNHLKIIAVRNNLRDKAKRNNYKPGFVFFKLAEQFGKKIAKKYQPFKGRI